jgi:isoleucyl-tRNA synthetase
MMSNSAPWENLKFNEESLKETQRKLFNTLLNTYSFFAMYANIDKFRYAGAQVPYTERTEMDRWIISRQYSTIKMVDHYLEEYDVTRACREIEDFVEELSNWYVRRSRRRFWKEGKTLDKTAAYQTLFECLMNVSKLISPVAPYMGEWLYQKLNEVTEKDELSVHISFYPTVEETAIDKQLEYRMELARKITSIVLRIRNKENINVRQPLSRIILPVSGTKDKSAIESVKNIILDEVNVKAIEYVKDDSGIVHKSAKANFPILGKKIGGLMKATSARIQVLSSEEITKFEEQGSLTVTLDSGEIITLQQEDIVVIRHGLSGWSVETEDGLTVAADTELTDELVNEGIARELVNRIQNMRKEANYDVTDRIIVVVSADERTQSAVKAMEEYIMTETLAESLTYTSKGDYDYTKVWDINGVEVTIFIKRTIK